MVGVGGARGEQWPVEGRLLRAGDIARVCTRVHRDTHGEAARVHTWRMSMLVDSTLTATGCTPLRSALYTCTRAEGGRRAQKGVTQAIDPGACEL